MSKLCGLIAGLLVLSVLPAPAAAQDDPKTLLRFDTMAGVTQPFLGTASPLLRDVPGGGRPWVLSRAKGDLDADGELTVKVRGLIIPAADGFGFNPVAFFRAIASCVTIDELGAAVVRNVPTANGAEVMIGDPRNGDANIEVKVDLPTPCLAPVVFVTSPTGAWFAVTGN